MLCTFCRCLFFFCLVYFHLNIASGHLQIGSISEHKGQTLLASHQKLVSCKLPNCRAISGSHSVSRKESFGFSYALHFLSCSPLAFDVYCKKNLKSSRANRSVFLHTAVLISSLREHLSRQSQIPRF